MHRLFAPLMPQELNESTRDERRKAGFIIFSSVVIVPLGLLFIIQRLIFERELTPTLAALLLITVCFSIAPIQLRLTGKSLYSGLTMVYGLVLFIAFVSFYNGGATAPALIWAPAIPMLAVLAVGPRTGLISGLLLILLMVFYHYADQEIFPLPNTLGDSKLDWIRFLASTTLVLVIASLAWFYETSRRRVLALAQHRLVELEALNLELRLANEKAEQASQAKSDFLTHINHELRTPLNGIIGMTSLLRRTSLDGTQKEQVETIHLCGDQLLQLINMLLDLSKIESGKLLFESSAIDLGRLVHDVVRMFAIQARQKGLFLNARLWSEQEVWVLGDPLRLRQILMNLVGNAIKFTAKGGVRVYANMVSENERQITVQFEVIDTGIGISEGARADLFEPFVQADSSITRKFGGSGLGLSICHNLVNALGGELAFDSQEKQGSLFKFTLVFERAPAPWRQAQASTSGTPIENTSAPPFVEGRKTVLVVEDNMINRKVTQLHLTALGYDSAFAANGFEGVKLFKHQHFDAVLMDCQMPEMDGYEATRQIRVHEGESRKTPIIALTAHTLDHEIERARAAGMSAHLTKPFELEDLQTALRRYLGPN